MRPVLFAMLLTLLLTPVASRADDAVMRDYIPGGAITRFESPVRFWLGGEGRLEGQYYIDTVVSELRRIIPQLPMQQVSSMGQANVRIFLTDSKEEWQTEMANCSEGASMCQELAHLIRGFTRVAASPQGAIKRADMVLHLDFQTSGGQKLWIVRHEFMHALGVMDHPKAAPDSVLNSMQTQENKNGNFSQSDILVLRTIYDPRMTAGGSW